MEIKKSQKGKTPPDAKTFWKLTDKKNDQFSLWKHEKANYKIARTASRAFFNAELAVILTLPLLTTLAISDLRRKDLARKPALVRAALVPLGVIADIIKAPLLLLTAIEEGSRASVTKLISLVFERHPLKKELRRIYKSFLQRIRDTVNLLVELGIEEKKVLQKKIKTGDIQDLLGLSLFLTAYISRHYPEGLLLTKQKKLEYYYCPKEALPLFNKIINLKNSINLALTDIHDKNRIGNDENQLDTQRDLKEAQFFCEWIKLIKEGKPITIQDKPDASPSQINIINQIIIQISDLKLSGIKVLPESPEKVARHIPKK